MEKYAWRGRIAEGKVDEYVRRHSQIWPEMLEELKKAGICNYTIWRDGLDLFGYYECEKGAKFACDYQASSKLVQKWEEHMKDVLIMVMDPVTKAQPKLVKVFEMD